MAAAPCSTSRRDRVLKGNPYQLDGEGRIALPISPPINLSGLSDVQAAQLLNADPRLAGLSFSVTLLPVEPAGAEALKPFGYDLFDQVPTTFAPATDIPVPSDYRIGPGDNVIVELFGKKTGRYQLVVDRNGVVDASGVRPDSGHRTLIRRGPQGNRPARRRADDRRSRERHDGAVAFDPYLRGWRCRPSRRLTP